MLVSGSTFLCVSQMWFNSQIQIIGLNAQIKSQEANACISKLFLFMCDSSHLQSSLYFPNWERRFHHLSRSMQASILFIMIVITSNFFSVPASTELPVLNFTLLPTVNGLSLFLIVQKYHIPAVNLHFPIKCRAELMRTMTITFFLMAILL